MSKKRIVRDSSHLPSEIFRRREVVEQQIKQRIEHNIESYKQTGRQGFNGGRT